MKKILRFSLCLILTAFCCIGYNTSNVSAFENSKYSIDIPSKYSSKDLDNAEQWINMVNGENINIATRKNSSKENVKKYTKSQIELYKNSIKVNFSSEYSKSGMSGSASVKEIKSDTVKIKNHDALRLRYVTEWEQDGQKATFYQTQYMITTKNYIYCITFTYLSEDSMMSGEEETIMDSFKAKDDPIKSSIFDTLSKSNLLVIFFSGGLVVLVFTTIINKRKKKEMERMQSEWMSMR